MNLKVAKGKATLVFSICFFIFLVFLCIKNFSSVAGESLIYGSEEAFSWVRLVDDRTVTQDVVAIHGNIVDISFTVDNCRDQIGTLEVSITNEEGNTVFSQNIGLQGQGENMTVNLPVGEIHFEKGETYVLTIHALNTPTQISEAPMVRLYKLPERWERVFPAFHNEMSLREGQSALSVTFFHYRIGAMAVLGACGILLLFFGLFDLDPSDLSEKAKARYEKAGKIAKNLFLGLTPLFTLITFETANGYAPTMEYYAWGYNIAIFYAIFCFFWFLTGRIRVMSMLLQIIFTSYGITNYFVSSWKGDPIMPYDFAAANTAFTVAGTYSWVFTYGVIAALLMAWALFVFTSKCRIEPMHGRKHLIGAVIGGVLPVIFIGLLIFTEFLAYRGITVRYWRLTESYQAHGYMLNTFSSIGDMIIASPDGYSVDSLRELADGVERGPETENITPTNIIFIMNESYADFRYVRDIEVSENVWSVLDRLYADEHTFTTRLHMDVYGSGTSTSEYMVLTGNSTTFLPSGTSPYYLYSQDNEYSLASILREQGWRTVAMHPNLPENWKRNVVYDYMGFDEFYAIDDYQGYETLRDYVSDMADYRFITDLYEDKPEGQPLFIYNITMQNHGAYTYSGYNFNQDVYYYSDDYYGKANQYLTLLKYSNQALDYLLNYFENVDEPTMIVFFGDHWPSLGTAFQNDLFGQDVGTLSSEQYELRYVTPAFIWTNYDWEFEEIDDLSANYLGALALRYAGVETTEYQEFLLDQMEQYPVIGHMGLIDADGNFTAWDQVHATPEIQNVVNDYWMWQYNYTFGGNNRQDDLFDLPGSPEGVHGEDGENHMAQGYAGLREAAAGG